MKTLKHILDRIGLLPTVDTARRIPAIIGWVNDGCSGIAPPPIKRKVIKSYLRRYQIRTFVETGTHVGDTLASVARNSDIQSISIEMAETYYSDAKRRFSTYRNVNLHHGDSGELMPGIVASLQAPALFWLDGHYSGGQTAKGKLETPVSDELEAILSSPIAGHVILIDDVRCFNGTHDYPHLDEILNVVRSNSRYCVEISADILRLTPKKTE